MWWLSLWLLGAGAWGADERIERQRPTAPDPNARITLDFGETTLFDLSLFFADLMRKNLLLTNEEELRNRTARLVGHEAMTTAEAWETFLVTLRDNGFTVDETANVVRIVPTRDGTRGSVPVKDGAPAPGESLVTGILPLTNAQAKDVVSLVTPLLSADAVVAAYLPGNRLVVTDTAANVRKAADLVERIDWAAPESTVKRTPLVHADAEEVVRILTALYPPAPAQPAPSSGRRRRSTKAKAAASTPTTAGVRKGHIEQILADTRTNAVLVLADATGHAAVAEIVTDLDVDADPDARKQLHVVPLQFAMVDELLPVLESLQDARKPDARPRPNAKPTDLDDVGPMLDGDLRLAADPATNSLIVVADPLAYHAVARLVEQLDVVRGQVFIDAVFVELTHTGGNEIGFSAHVAPSDGTPAASLGLDPSGQVNSLSISPDLLSGLAAGVFGTAIDVVGADGSTLSVPRFGIAIRALQTRSDVQVMGNPSFLTLDHNEAELSVGRRIPYATGQQITGIGSTIQSFERQDVATSLVVTPHINSDVLVTMDVELVVEEVEGSSTESNLQGGPVTSSRTVDSRVMVETGQTIVIAANLGTRTELKESKVPFLGDLPLIGALFRGREKESRDSQLMVFLTPTIVTSPTDLLRIRKQKEAQRAEFVRRFQGKRGEAWLAELERLLVPNAPEAELVPLSKREQRRERRQRKRRSK